MKIKNNFHIFIDHRFNFQTNDDDDAFNGNQRKKKIYKDNIQLSSLSFKFFFHLHFFVHSLGSILLIRFSLESKKQKKTFISERPKNSTFFCFVLFCYRKNDEILMNFYFNISEIKVKFQRFFFWLDFFSLVVTCDKFLMCCCCCLFSFLYLSLSLSLDQPINFHLLLLLFFFFLVENIACKQFRNIMDSVIPMRNEMNENY